MKRFWLTSLTIVAVAAMVSTASAQSGSRYAPEIGSYQSILSRAGYSDAQSTAAYAQNMQTMPTYGQPVQGCASGNCGNGMAAQSMNGQSGGTFGYNGGMATGQSYAAQPAQGYTTSPLPGAQAQGAMVPSSSDPVVSSYEGPCGGGVAGGGYAGYAAAPAYSAPVYAPAPVYAQAPVYSPGAAIGGQGAIAGRGNGSNLVFSAGALALVRDYEDGRLISRNPVGDVMFTDQADHDVIGGVDFSLTSRKQNGSGWEARYFGLFADQASATLTGAPVTAVGLRGFDRLTYDPGDGGGPRGVDTYFANGTSQTVTRDTDIQNIEFNLLRNGGRYCTRRGRQANFELLGGFRYFQFDEDFVFSTRDGAIPLDYTINTENTLLGLQVGGRSEICLSNRLRAAGGIRTGLFNNNINTRQRITNDTGAITAVNPTGARDFDYRAEKNDVALLSEIDLGLIYQLSCRARFRVGYRALGVTGVALAVNQIPEEFDNARVLETANSNGGLLLHGGYFGTEFCF